MSERVLALSLLAMIAGALSIVDGFDAASAAAPKGTYYGATSDLGRFEIDFDGFNIVQFRVSPATPAVANQCLDNWAVSRLNGTQPGSGGSFDLSGGLISATDSTRIDIIFKGSFDQAGAATGTLRAQPGSGTSCVVREVTWSAVLRPGTAAPSAGASLTGVTDKGGTVTLGVTADGSAATRVSIQLPHGCRAISTGTATLTRFTDGLVVLRRTATTGGAVDAVITILISGDQVAGAYAASETAPSSCSGVVGTFTAKVAGALPPAAGPPPTSTGGVVGAIPGANAAGLLVTGGAATAAELVTQLGTRGCAVASLAVLRQGTWSVYVNGAPAAVNSAFPSLAASTPFYLRCG